MTSVCLRLGAVLLGVAAVFQAASNVQADEQTGITLSLRSQTPIKAGAAQFHTLTRQENWAPQETAIIICDVWDRHHCLNAVRRIDEFGPRLNEVVKNLRERGVTVIHAPSDCMEAYKDHPARRRVSETPVNNPLPSDIQAWCNRIPGEEQAVYPIDQSDGGEDDDPEEHAKWAAKLTAEGRNPAMPWKKQSDLIEIDDSRDFISDKGDEVWSVLESRGVKNVILAGVHTNMCVLGRPFGLRQMVRNGKNAVLLRDMTDTMYNPQMWPYVSHFEGTDRIVSHVERHVCPTITSDQILGGEPFRFQGDTRPHVVLLMSEHEYETERTVTDFAIKHLGKDFRVSYVYGLEENGSILTNLDALKSADVMLVSVRRRTLPTEQLQLVREFIAAGKPAIGIRTASHAFALREGEPPEGTALWPEFDAEVWGGSYHGHYGDELATTVHPVQAEAGHPILTGVGSEAFASTGTLYETAPLHKGTLPLAIGRVDGKPNEPCAWTFTRADGGKSFYTSLGHKGDFRNPKFERLLLNAICWAAGREVPAEWEPTPANEFRRHWNLVQVPGGWGLTTSRLFDATRDDTWLRCVVRFPQLQKGETYQLKFATRHGASVRGFLNGSEFHVETNSGGFLMTNFQATIPAKLVTAGDANRLVLWIQPQSSTAAQGIEEAPTLRIIGPNSKTTSAPFSLDGRWQFRLGQQFDSYSGDPLPAKFASGTDAYFEWKR